jgi:hypothetical protein
MSSLKRRFERISPLNRKSETLQRNAKHIILIIVDDVRADQFFQLYNEGKMPNIKKIGDQGIICEHCVTTFPSITLPSQPAIMTGSYSGYFHEFGNGIPVYHWFDRECNPPKFKHYNTFSAPRMATDIGPNTRTIFEQVGSGNSYSIFQLISRGATSFTPKTKIWGLLMALYGFVIRWKPEVAHPLITKRVLKLFRNPKKYFKDGQKPVAVVPFYLMTDFLMHHHGFDSQRYIQCLLDFDTEIGKIVDGLRELGVLEDTVIGIISDHGNYKAKNVIDIRPFFNKYGMVPYNNRKGKGDFDASFGSVGFFNFPGNTWYDHPTIAQLQNYIPKVGNPNSQPMDLLKWVFEIPGVKFSFYRADGNTPHHGVINIVKKDEKGNFHNAKVEYEGLLSKYSFEDLDVFNYSADPLARKLIDNKFHTVDEWLDHTYHIDYPIIVDQLFRYFTNPRSCDIMVSTETEYCYNYSHNTVHLKVQYSHDVGFKSVMQVPFLIGGSSMVPKKKIEYCKTVDLLPTLLDFMGIKPYKNVDGKSIR